MIQVRFGMVEHLEKKKKKAIQSINKYYSIQRIELLEQWKKRPQNEKREKNNTKNTCILYTMLMIVDINEQSHTSSRKFEMRSHLFTSHSIAEETDFIIFIVVQCAHKIIYHWLQRMKWIIIIRRARDEIRRKN